MVRSARVCCGDRDGSSRSQWGQRLHGETEVSGVFMPTRVVFN